MSRFASLDHYTFVPLSSRLRNIAALGALCLASLASCARERCEGVTCRGGVWVATVRCDEEVVLDDCDARGQACDAVLGCFGCTANTRACRGQDVVLCDAAHAETTLFRCAEEEGTACSGGRCVTLCEAAQSESSYVGCEHLAVTTANPLLNAAFRFVVVLGNGWNHEVASVVWRGDVQIAEVRIAPQGSAEVALPWVPELARASASTLIEDGAYRIVSSSPVSAYQYSPLEFRLRDACAVTGTNEDLACFSFTNDASLLLPTHALGDAFLIDTREGQDGAGAFIAIAATEDLTVELDLTAPTLVARGSTLLSIAPHEARLLTLPRGAVLQLLSASGSFVGSYVHASGPVQVFAGHRCANVPSGTPACDHLEEVMPPLDTWGRHFIVAAPRVVEGEPSIVRVLAGSDDTSLSISSLDAPIPLMRGAFFEWITRDDVEIEATQPVLVTQYLVGATYFDRSLPGRARQSVGDPSMGLVPPLEQHRRSYTFAVPSSFDVNFAAIVARLEDDVFLDGERLDEGMPLGALYTVRRIEVRGGAHRLTSASPLGLTLYGEAPFTSYLLPGGLDVERIQ